MRPGDRRLVAGARARKRRAAFARCGWAITVLLLAALVSAPGAWAATPVQDITSAGPLTDVWIGNELGCQIAHAGDTSLEFFPSDSGSTPGDCGTFLSFGGNLFGPDFANHPGGSATPFSGAPYAPFTPVAQSGVAGSGTAASPYQVTTAVSAGTSGVGISEVDSYVIGNEYYRTDITVSNAGASPLSALLYRAADCFLQSSDTGFGFVDPANNGPACTQNANNSPPGQVEQFSPLTGPIHQVEGNFSSVWQDIASQVDLPDTCDCTTDEDNGTGINWDVSLAPSGSATFSMLTNFSPSGQLIGAPTVVTGSASGVSQSAAALSGSVNPNGGPVSDCHFDWGTTTAYGQTAACASSPGSGTTAVAVSAALSGLAASTTYHFRVVATNPSGTSAGGDQAFTTLPVASPPVLLSSSVPVVQGSSGAAFVGVVDPEGLLTSAHFEYGLDPKYSGGGPVVYDGSTLGQVVGSDFGGHGVSAVVSGLVPNALYHVRLVASNSAGTVFAPDETFVTGRDPVPSVPVIARSANLVLVSGLVLIRAPQGSKLGAARASAAGGLVKGQGFVPLTEARQVPIGSEIDARRGTLDVVVASGHARRTQRARLAGAVFASSQARTGPLKGLTTFGLLEGAFSGAPSYRSCGARTAVVGSSVAAQAARLSPSVLQTLRASDHGGRFRTRGRYSAATVRGTIWDTVDRCDGTLTVVKRGSVGVLDFARRKTITVRAGHSYLAKALQPRRTP
jgi:hypothetical protein